MSRRAAGVVAAAAVLSLSLTGSAAHDAGGRPVATSAALLTSDDRREMARIRAGHGSLLPVNRTHSLAGRVIVIDPGHNGGNAAHRDIIRKLVDAGNGVRKTCNTTGTQADDGYSEHAFAWDVAQRLATELRARGAVVMLTRSSDRGVGPCVTHRADTANKAHADVLISIHADGNLQRSARGFHVITSTRMGRDAGLPAASLELARTVRSAFATGTGMPYSTYTGRGTAITHRQDMGTLNLATMPAVMIEAGNLRQARDARLLRSASWRAKAAGSLARGVETFLSR